MARPRRFDEERAVDAAMRAFWARGYEATSTGDLCEATGLGRSSLYNAFAGKRELFARSLDEYSGVRDRTLRSVLDGAAPIRDKVRTLLWDAVSPPADDPPGCLCANSMVELAPGDPEAREQLQRHYRGRVEALTAAIEDARANGEVAAATEPRPLAQLFLATITALQVRARAGADRAELEAIAETALRLL